MAAGSDALHAPQAHKSQKRLLTEPALCALGIKGFHDVTDLFFIKLLIERYKQAWLAQVSVIFRNFVLEYQVVPKRIPGQFRN